MKRIIIQKEPINISRVIEKIGIDSDGAVASFIGRPRNDSHGRKVKYLVYEIYENMARSEMDKIAKDAISRWPISSCKIIHRYGKVEIGEASIFIAVSSSHRAEAFQAVKYIIDTVKLTVPIWKTEYYANGTCHVFDRS